jgi:hypothetical protein
MIKGEINVHATTTIMMAVIEVVIRSSDVHGL